MSDPIVKKFSSRRIQAVDLRSKIARMVSETMKDCELSRKAISERMSKLIGEEVSVNMLNAYASEARIDFTITFVRMIGLVRVTGDIRIIQKVAEFLNHSVVDDKWLDWVEVGRLSESKVENDNKLEAALLIAKNGVK